MSLFSLRLQGLTCKGSGNNGIAFPPDGTSRGMSGRGLRPGLGGDNGDGGQVSDNGGNGAPGAGAGLFFPGMPFPGASTSTNDNAQSGGTRPDFMGGLGYTGSASQTGAGNGGVGGGGGGGPLGGGGGGKSALLAETVIFTDNNRWVFWRRIR